MASVASSAPDLRHRQLIAASAQANEARVREILGEDPVWSSQTDHDALRQSLQKVATRGNLGVTKLLLGAGADVEPLHESETAALFKAAEAGHIAIVAELLAHGANPNLPVRTRWKQTALFPACFRGHNKVVGLLLEHGADVGVRDNEGRTPLLFLASEKQQGVRWGIETLKLLVERGGASLEVQDKIGRTPLLWAATNGNLSLVEALLDGSLGGHKTADLEAANNRGRTALHLAAEANHEAMVQLLLRHRAEANAVSDGGWTALHNAAQNGHAGVVAQLLAAGVHVNAELSNGMTPLHWAAFNGHEAVVRQLLERDETRLDIKDSFDRTPMLCAAERFHRDIVRMLSPVHAARRLSPAARKACEEFKATIVDFGRFRDGKQHQVFKKSVFDVLYGWDKETNKPKVETQTKNIKYQPEFRWIHLPANNIAWVEALLAKWFIDGGHRDIEPFKALEKCFDQEHHGPLAHAHFMRTFCHRIPSLQVVSPADREDKSFAPVAEEPSATADVVIATGSGSGSGGDATPSHDGTPGTPRPETSKRKGKGELIAERHGRRAKRTNGPPGNPPGTKALKAARMGQAPLVWDASRLPSSNGKIVLFMPFLHYETDERRQRMSHCIDLIQHGWDPPTGSPRDIMLVKGYLQNTPPLHPRRTLDQFFYHGIDTSIRDIDQVVYRYCKRHSIVKKVFMVDQLWLWVLGRDLVITCFPQRWDQPSRDPLNVVDGIIEETNAKTRPPIQSVYDLAMLITNRCSGMFDRYRLGDQDYQFLDMFESSIGLVTNTESELFSRFNRASELSSEWLELHRRPQRRQTAGGLASSLSSTLSASSPSLPHASADPHDRHQLHATTPVFPDALLDIGTETSLLAEIKDIRDELNILAVILASQMATLEEFETSITDELRPEGMTSSRRGGGGGGGGGSGSGSGSGAAAANSVPGSVTVDTIMAEVRKRSREQKRLLDVHRKDIERMDRQAESIYLSLTHLLDLKQKHSNALEARFARDHAMIAARQGQTIMTFTIVTILFLPMSFIAAFFSIQIKSWQDTLTVGYVSKYMFGIGLGISIPLIVMAFTVSEIYDAAYHAYAALQSHGSRWRLPWRPKVLVRPPGAAAAAAAAAATTAAAEGHPRRDSLGGDSLATMEKVNKVLGTSAAGVESSSGARRGRWSRGGPVRPSYDGDGDGHSPVQQRQHMLQPNWGRAGSSRATRPGSGSATAGARKYSIGSSGRNWPSFDRARPLADDDLEKGPAAVTTAETEHLGRQGT